MNTNITFFASGSNHAGEIRALALVPGANVGIVADAVSDLHPEAKRELDLFSLTNRKVFIDSGAFSEIKFGPTGPVVVKPLTDDDWIKIFAVYIDAALVHGANAFVVAPDKVGFQADSLDRLATYAEEVRGLFSLGATVLVPLQKGELSLADCYRRSFEILNAGDPDGGIEFTPSIPCKKDATSLSDLAAFVREIKPASIHLLGIAPDTVRGRKAIAVVEENSPGTKISCDACLIKRWVGKNNGRGGKARRITQLNGLHQAKLALDLEAVGDAEVHVRKVLTLYLAAECYWTDLGLAELPAYGAINFPAGCEDIEPAYLTMAGSLWGVPAEREAERLAA